MPCMYIEWDPECEMWFQRRELERLGGLEYQSEWDREL